MSKIKIDEESIGLYFQTYKKMLQAHSNEDEKIDRLAHFYEMLCVAEEFFGIQLKDKIGNLDD